MVFDPDGAGNRALKVGYPIGSSDYRYETGTGAGRSAVWDLNIAPGDGPPVKLLTERGYRAPFPTAKTMVRHPLATFDGQVELDGARMRL
jgi:hypothetical protein